MNSKNETKDIGIENKTENEDSIKVSLLNG
jgi:hypothetical protein